VASGGTAQAVAWTPGEERARSVRIVGGDPMLTLDTTSDQVAQVLVDSEREERGARAAGEGAVDRQQMEEVNDEQLQVAADVT
jgi:hypothetical protein